MDDITWQRKIRQRRRRRKLSLFLTVLFLTLVIGSAIWYFGIYRRSPEFALREAVAAIASGDAATFDRYVDLDEITTHAYDDLTVDLFAYDATLNDKSKVMFEKFYVLIKPEMVGGTKDMIDRRITGGSWQLPSGTDILKGRQLGIDYERFIERSQLRTTELVKLGDIRREGDEAVATIEVKEERTATPFALELEMKKAEDGHWRVESIRNYRAYLDAVAPVVNRDIASYIDATKEIVAKYNQIIDRCRERYVASSTTTDGNMTEGQRVAIADMLEKEVIPALEKRQSELDAITVPPGATYLAKQRKDSTETTIASWQHYIRALRTLDPTEFAKAQALHKEELAIDLRIDDIIHHTAVSRSIPNLP